MAEIITPRDEAELAEAVAGAAGAGTPLEIRGGGTRVEFGRPVQASRLHRPGLEPGPRRIVKLGSRSRIKSGTTLIGAVGGIQ